MDFSTRLRGINPTNTVFYSPQPRAEVYCLLMNFKISKLAYLLGNVGLSSNQWEANSYFSRALKKLHATASNSDRVLHKRCNMGRVIS